MKLNSYDDWREPDEYDGSSWELVDKKSVQDSDGFYTDYSLYYNEDGDFYVTVFGDSDIYKPEDGEYDMEFDNESEALEWFNSYEGFTDDAEGRFHVEGYYDARYIGLVDSFETDDWSEATDMAHEFLSNGDYTLIFDTKTGGEVRLDPDEYFEDFNGEFPVSVTDLDPNYFD